MSYEGSDDEKIGTVLSNNESNGNNYDVVSNLKSDDKAEENFLKNTLKKKLK